MRGELVAEPVTPLYLRISAILVRPASPKHMTASATFCPIETESSS
jgi:accessory colonization factor AcfC